VPDETAPATPAPGPDRQSVDLRAMLIANGIGPACSAVQRFRYALFVVDTSGVVAEIESWTSTGLGRPRTSLPVRTVFAAAIATAIDQRPGHVSEWVRSLNALPPDMLLELGATAVDGDVLQVQRWQVAVSWNRVADALDPSPFRHGRRVIDADGERCPKEPRPKPTPICQSHRSRGRERCSRCEPIVPTRPSTRGLPRCLSAEDLAERERRLHFVTDRLLQATLLPGMIVPAAAVDATAHETWARTYRKAVTSADNDAAWGWRHGANRSLPIRRRRPANVDPEADSGEWRDPLKNQLFFGFELDSLVASALPGEPHIPGICLSHRLRPANDMDVGRPVISMIDSVHRAGIPIYDLTMDRGYSMRRPESIFWPLADRLVHVTFDYPEHERTFHGSHRDAPLFADCPYCPALAETMQPPQRPKPTASAEEWAAYDAAWAVFEKGFFRPLGAPKGDMVQRYQCPAQRTLRHKTDRVICPLVKGSKSQRRGPGALEVFNPPKGLACCATSMTLDRHTGRGKRQRFVYGSPQWEQSYARRTTVERYFAELKRNGRIEGDNIVVFGLARRSLVLTFVAVATNLRLNHRWLTKGVEPVPDDDVDRAVDPDGAEGGRR